MKICPVEAEFFHAEGRAETEGRGTDWHDENSRFSQFCERA